MNKNSFPICKQNKDSHCNTIGHEWVLASTGRHASIYERSSGIQLHTLKIEEKEMSSSLVLGNKLFIGTYVDTLYMFSIPEFKKLCSVRTHESILSIVSMNEQLLCLGQADGNVDFISISLGKEG
jgi:hypothetical protein